MYVKYLKRFLDISLSLIGLIILLLPMVIVGLIIRIDDSGPAIFKQERVGFNKKIFVLYKFRTMKIGTPDIATNALEHSEQYITKIGAFIRKFSIDELPQLINILKGEMSIIGPRPVISDEVDLISERDKYGVYSVKPGLTGLAQINGRDIISNEEKARLDAEYMENVSFGLDVRCFFGTILKVLKSENVVEGKNNIFDEKILEEDTVKK